MHFDSIALELTHPARLICLAVLPLLIYYFYRSLVDFPRWQRAISFVVRSVIVLLLVLSLAGLTLLHPTHQQYTIFALDRSTSVGAESTKRAEEFLNQAIPAAGENRVAFLPFSNEPAELTP